MKVGIELRIDVKKIEKARLYEGAKGTYLTMTTFVDLDEKDEYGNNGFIAHKKNQDEQGNTPILGNSKVFWSDGAAPAQQPAATPAPTTTGGASSGLDDDIPFAPLQNTNVI